MLGAVVEARCGDENRSLSLSMQNLASDWLTSKFDHLGIIHFSVLSLCSISGLSEVDPRWSSASGSGFPELCSRNEGGSCSRGRSSSHRNVFPVVPFPQIADSCLCRSFPGQFCTMQRCTAQSPWLG